MTTATTTTNSYSVFTPNWAILATEAAVVLLVLALVIGLVAWLNRRKRINAARTLLDERDDLAETATETFHTHVQALSSEWTLTPDDLDDYQQRSLQVINELIEPWLAPSAENLREAVRQIMMIRHNDLHQIAALFRQQLAAKADSEKTAPLIQQLQTELTASHKAEAERTAQLAEALKSVSIIVGEYGRKFGVEADYRAPQILRALIYLQSLDQGMNQKQATLAADASMERDIEVFEEDSQTQDPANTATPSVSIEPESSAEVASSAPDTATIEPTDHIESTPSRASEAPTHDQAEEILDSKVPEKSALTEKTKQRDELNTPDPSKTKLAPVFNEPTSNDNAKEEKAEASEDQIDLDAIELPEKDEELTEFNLNLDDIDALLDAEISRQQQNKPDEPAPTLPDLDDDDEDLDLSKKH